MRIVAIVGFAGAALCATGSVFAQAGAKTAQAVEINMTSGDAAFQQLGGTTWKYEWAGNQPETLAAFDLYFDFVAVGLNDNAIKSQKQQAMHDQRCNFFCGAPLQGGSAQGLGHGKSFAWAPKAGVTQHAARTGWTATEIGSDGPLTVTLDPYVQVQSFVMKAKPQQQQPWTKKYSFGINPAGTSLTITGTHTPDSGATQEIIFPVVLGADAVIQNIAGDHLFTLNPANVNGNNEAQAYLMSGQMNAILNGIHSASPASPDDHIGNNNTGGQRLVFAPQTFQLNSPGMYVFSITGVVQGIDASGPQSIDFTLSTVTSGGCACGQ